MTTKTAATRRTSEALTTGTILGWDRVQLLRLARLAAIAGKPVLARRAREMAAGWEE